MSSYQYYRRVFEGQRMPFAFVDLDLLQQNIVQIQKRSGKKLIRIASKSIRCVHLIKKILATHSQFQGIMAFTPLEAVFLSQQGLDDLLVGYPSWHETPIAAVCQELKQGKQIVLMVDLAEHIQRLQELGKKYDVVIPICIDIDMSSEYPGLHFGVHRSSITGKKKARKLLKVIEQSPFVRLVGVMGYEAQIAGVGDNVPKAFVMNNIIKQLKKRSVVEIAERRAAIVDMIQKKGIELDFVNGGGTGSLETTTEEDAVTEVTVGSAFYASGLFDYYSSFKHQAAAAYAIEIARQPKEHIYTCSGGGYIASGSAGKDKAPSPYLPKGSQLTNNEGAGEVQTPIVYKGKEQLSLGDPIFMRHSKAGELCERFNELLLVSKGAIVNKVPTYRGQGQCFL